MSQPPTLLCLHGFMGRASVWTPLFGRIQPPITPIALDLPGHGANLPTDPADYSFPATAAYLLNWLDERHIASCHLLGYSMGGRMAAYFALHHPERVRSLILESANLGIRQAQERAARAVWDRAMADKVSADGMAHFLRDWYSMALFDSLRAQVGLETLVQQRLANRPDQLAKSLCEAGTGTMPPLWETWPRFDRPTLLIAGALDAKYIAIGRQMAALNAYAQLVIVPQTGHNVHLERPEPFARLINRFLQGLPA